ncbi:MAG: sulfite reductase, partial [Hyphomonadaceae bacterium]|nr:sulfite reductase [Hyphomonadaceae bacterium]
YYQITLGGRADEKATIGQMAGPGLKADDVPVALKRLVDRYRELRTSKDETFIETFEREGMEPFKDAIYAGA